MHRTTEGETAEHARVTAKKKADSELRVQQAAHKKLRQALQPEKTCVKQLWGRNCQQLAEHEAVLTEKAEEIATLKDALHRRTPSVSAMLEDAYHPSGMDYDKSPTMHARGAA